MDSTDSNKVLINSGRMTGALVATGSLIFVVFTYFVTKGAAMVLIIIGIICLLAALYAFLTLGKAACPDCGHMVLNLALKNNDSVECPGCGGYFHTKDGVIIETAEDAVEDFPAFATACPKSIKWPEGCCVCGEAVTGTAPIQLELEEDTPVAKAMLTRAVSLGTFKLVSKRVFEVQVPVCDEHREVNAELDFRFEEEQVYIRFRSRPYMRAFAELNGPVFWDS